MAEAGESKIRSYQNEWSQNYHGCGPNSVFDSSISFQWKATGKLQDLSRRLLSVSQPCTDLLRVKGHFKQQVAQFVCWICWKMHFSGWKARLTSSITVFWPLWIEIQPAALNFKLPSHQCWNLFTIHLWNFCIHTSGKRSHSDRWNDSFRVQPFQPAMFVSLPGGTSIDLHINTDQSISSG